MVLCGALLPLQSNILSLGTPYHGNKLLGQLDAKTECGRPFDNQTRADLESLGLKKQRLLVLLILENMFKISASVLSFLSFGSGESAGEMPPTPDRFHQPATAGVRKPVQTQQVPVKTQTL